MSAANQAGADPVLSPPTRHFRLKQPTKPWFQKPVEATGCRGKRVASAHGDRNTFGFPSEPRHALPFTSLI
jgi:hypothetical protein